MATNTDKSGGSEAKQGLAVSRSKRCLRRATASGSNKQEHAAAKATSWRQRADPTVLMRRTKPWMKAAKIITNEKQHAT